MFLYVCYIQNIIQIVDILIYFSHNVL